MSPRRLNPTELLDAASVCRDRPAAEAALYLAALEAPGASFEECAHLGIGQRDMALAGFYAELFGRQLELAATCPECRARLDVSLSTDALLIEPDPNADPRIEIGGRLFRVRPADSGDLAAIAAIADSEAARKQLALRCLVPAEGEDVPDELSETEVDAVAAALVAIDPASDFYVSLTCFRCKAAWDASVDIARILATEIVIEADTLMDDIHDLALAYHWSEEAILALAPVRRRAYLQRLRG
jgi:hypothetical protein